MKLILATALLAAASFACAPGQLRASGERSAVTVPDASGDGRPGHADLKSVTPSSTPTTLSWTIVAYGSFATAKAPCVDIVSVQPGGLHWTICGTANKGFGIETSSPYPRGGGYSGTADVSRPNSTTVVYHVKRAYITAGANLKPQPHLYSWQVRVLDQPGCNPAACDSAPDGARIQVR